MNGLFPIHYHPSAHPRHLEDLRAQAFTTGRVDPALHYVSPRQALRWIEVHQAHCPALRADFDTLYRQALLQAAARLVPQHSWLLSLGCGTGRKELPLLESGTLAGAIALDLSAALVWSAWACWQSAAPGTALYGVAAHLGTVDTLTTACDAWTGSATRLVTCFGLLPNLDPAATALILEKSVRRGDWLLLGANLLPAPGGLPEMRRILAQYDNPETRRWLATFLQEADLPDTAWSMDFSISQVGEWHRIEAQARFHQTVQARWSGGAQTLEPGAQLLLFFSQRPTAAQVRTLLAESGLDLQQEWLMPGGEEGLWLCQRTP